VPDRVHPLALELPYAPRARHPSPDRPRHGAGRHNESRSIQIPFQVGRFLVSPLTRRLDGGRFSAGVSIRSGSGSMTHDRVMRFNPLFDTHEQATRFAAEQAMAWLGRPAVDVAPITLTQD